MILSAIVSVRDSLTLNCSSYSNNRQVYPSCNYQYDHYFFATSDVTFKLLLRWSASMRNFATFNRMTD